MLPGNKVSENDDGDTVSMLICRMNQRSRVFSVHFLFLCVCALPILSFVHAEHVMAGIEASKISGPVDKKKRLRKRKTIRKRKSE